MLLDVLEDHFDEASFLWQKRAGALTSWVWHKPELRRLEGRLLAHLDGLVIGGEMAWELMLPALAKGKESEVAVVAWSTLERDVEAAMNRLFLAMCNAPPAVFRGARDALRLSTNPRLTDLVGGWLEAVHWSLRALSVDALGFRGTALAPEAVGALLADHAPAVVAAAATAAGRLGLKVLVPRLERLFAHEDADVRGQALWSAMLLGSAAAKERCRACIDGRQPEASVALQLLGRLGDMEDFERLRGALEQPDLVRPALCALGSFGHAAAVPQLVRLCQESVHAGLAAVAVQRICGVDWGKEQLLAPVASDDPEAGLAEAAEALPRVDGAKLALFWQRAASRFHNESRYLYGKPHNPELLLNLLEEGSLAEQHEVAYKLALCESAQGLRQTERLLS